MVMSFCCREFCLRSCGCMDPHKFDVLFSEENDVKLIPCHTGRLRSNVKFILTWCWHDSRALGLPRRFSSTLGQAWAHALAVLLIGDSFRHICLKESEDELW